MEIKRDRRHGFGKKVYFKCVSKIMFGFKNKLKAVFGFKKMVDNRWTIGLNELGSNCFFCAKSFLTKLTLSVL